MTVLGGDKRIPALTQELTNENIVKSHGLVIKSHFTPCHTRGHLLFEVSEESDPDKPHALFTGDTLFIG